MQFDLDPHDDRPLFSQLARQLRVAIARGGFSPTRPLPSLRTLVTLLRVNPQTVLRAFAALEQEGLIERRHGQGTFVVAGAVEKLSHDQQGEIIAELRRLGESARALGVSDDEIHGAVAAGGKHKQARARR